jgi:hypothetical protein
MYNEQTPDWQFLLYYSLFITPTRFNANVSSSGSSHLVPAKLRKHVHAVLVVFFHIRCLESLKH